MPGAEVLLQAIAVLEAQPPVLGVSREQESVADHVTQPDT